MCRVQIESKIFFCDAKTNTRGLYLKISEKKANRCARILHSLYH